MKKHKTTFGISVVCAALISTLPDALLAKPISDVIPAPRSAVSGAGNFYLTSSSRIYVVNSTPETLAIGQYLADKVKNSTGFLSLQTAISTPSLPGAGNIVLQLGGSSSLGEEGYNLNVSPAGSVVLTAFKPAGLFRGIQTIRQLLPAEIESQTYKNVTWTVPEGSITDSPRFQYRSSSLDVGRMFYSVADVKKYIDGLAYYKFNKFHFHLTENEGWRLQINSRPALTNGGSRASQGYYTQADYQNIVKYANERYIEVIPEIDVPGHTGALISAYPETNDGTGHLKVDNYIHFQGNWIYEAFPGAYNNDDTWSTTTNDTYSMVFQGNQVKIYGAKAPHHGIMAVSIDGGPEFNVDTYATSRLNNTLLFDSNSYTPLANGSHVVKVRVTGQKNVNSYGPGIVLDRMEVSNNGNTAVINDNSTGTYGILKDVFKELAAISPSPYIHIGGDESSSASFKNFVNEVKTMVEKNGKKIIGWDEINVANLDNNSIVQLWNYNGGWNAKNAVTKGAKVIASPCNLAYLDYGYIVNGVPGSFPANVAPQYKWRGCVSNTYSPTIADASNWDPATLVSGLSEASIIGIEAPTWGDSGLPYTAVEELAFPKLPSIAEIGWSQRTSRNWQLLKERLADHGERLRLQGYNFYPSAEILWINQDKSFNIDNSSIGTGLNQFEYIGNWTHELFNGAHAYSDSYSTTANSTVNVRFNGTKAKLFSATAPHHGMMAVSINGGPETIVNLYSTSRVNNTLVFTSPDLAKGNHTMTIRIVSGAGLVDRVAVSP